MFYARRPGEQCGCRPHVCWNPDALNAVTEATINSRNVVILTIRG